jgi:K+-transporting ATPase ATPase C chain
MSDSDAAATSSSSQPSIALEIVRQTRPAAVGILALTLITGGLYPAAIYGLGQFFFADGANGSLVARGGAVVGSRHIGQRFVRPEYFQPRPSAAGDGYDATQSGGTNLAPSNPKLIASVRQAAIAYRALNGLAPDAPVPTDAVTSSGSGLDPDISPDDAALQTARVARARGVSADLVRRLVAENTRGPDLGFLGQRRVSVLPLNLALDQAAPLRRP